MCQNVKQKSLRGAFVSIGRNFRTLVQPEERNILAWFQYQNVGFASETSDNSNFIISKFFNKPLRVFETNLFDAKDVIWKHKQQDVRNGKQVTIKKAVFVTYKIDIGIKNACKGEYLAYNKKKKERKPLN